MASLAVWMRALRAPFLTATVIPIVAGTMLALQTGTINWLLFVIILVASICVHLGLNLANDYFDHRSGNDEANTSFSPFNGGSRVIQEKLIPAQTILVASCVFFSISIALGLYLNQVLPGNTFLWIGILGIVIAFFYTAPPLKLGYNGLGELMTAIGFGPLMTIAAYFVQTRTITLEAFLASLPIGILVMLILFINEFPDFDADKKTKKRTWVVLFEKKTAKNFFLFFLVLTYLIVLIEIFVGILPYWSLITLLSIPLALKAATAVSKNYDKIKELLPANKATIGLHLIFGILFIVSLVIDAFV